MTLIRFGWRVFSVQVQATFVIFVVSLISSSTWELHVALKRLVEWLWMRWWKKQTLHVMTLMHVLCTSSWLLLHWIMIEGEFTKQASGDESFIGNYACLTPLQMKYYNPRKSPRWNWCRWKVNEFHPKAIWKFNIHEQGYEELWAGKPCVKRREKD